MDLATKLPCLITAIIYFHFTSGALEYWMICQDHTEKIWCRHKKKNHTVLICVFTFNLQKRHCILHSDGTADVKLNIQLLTETQANSLFTVSVRTLPSCQQLFNFNLNIWQSKTGFFLSLLLQDAIQAHCWVELQSLKGIRESVLLPRE